MIAVFDLDGTLADPTHRLHFIRGEDGRHDWRAFFRACAADRPIWPTIRVLESLYRSAETRVEVWTGRSDEAEDITRDWLRRHVGLWTVHGLPLRMRRADDRRPDDALKEDWLRGLPPERRPSVAFEDRTRVVEMWRRNGVLCCQVAPGDF